QVGLEGFARLRVTTWVRRLVTRLMAIVPALLIISLAGHTSLWGEGSVDKQLLDLLVFSQVVLSFQLPFAIVPLVQSTSDPRRMGAFASRRWLNGLAGTCAAALACL